MVKMKFILLTLILTFVSSCDTGFDIYLVNDSKENIIICRYSDYYAGKFDHNNMETILVNTGESCVFSPFGPLDPYMLTKEQIESILTSSIVYIEILTIEKRYYPVDWKKNFDSVYDGVNKSWSVKLSDIIDFN